MEEASQYFVQLTGELRPVFRNLTPYRIVVQHPKRGQLAEWGAGERPVSLQMDPPSKYKFFSNLTGIPMWYPETQMGFNHLPISAATNIIVTPDVADLMQRLRYPWDGHVLSPDVTFGTAHFEEETWYVERMHYWRLIPRKNN